MFARFLTDQSGATAIEYGLLCALIGLGLVVSLGNVTSGFSSVVNAIAAAFAAG